MAERQLTTNLVPIVAQHIPKDEKLIKNQVRLYMEKNSDSLAMAGPINQLLFGDKIKEDVLNTVGLNQYMVKKQMKISKDILDTAQVLNGFNMGCAVAIKHCIDVKATIITKNILFLLTMSFYPSLYRKYFPYGVKQPVMEYVVGNLTNKFKLKQKGLLNTFLELGEVCLENHKNNLIKGDDIGYVKFVNDLKTRMNQFFKKIKNEYDKAEKSNSAVLSHTTDYSGDEYRVAENNSFIIANATQNALQAIMVSGSNSSLFIKYAANITKISVAELRNDIYNLVHDPKQYNNIHDMIEYILTYFIQECQQREELIGSNDFLNKSMELLKNGNTGSKINPLIKNILEEWRITLQMDKRFKRPATQQYFQKGIYIYIVMMIMNNYK